VACEVCQSCADTCARLLPAQELVCKSSTCMHHCCDRGSVIIQWRPSAPVDLPLPILPRSARIVPTGPPMELRRPPGLPTLPFLSKDCPSEPVLLAPAVMLAEEGLLLCM
jgi:hypothetical protein